MHGHFFLEMNSEKKFGSAWLKISALNEIHF
jgi:hypothetical protein